MSPAKLLVFSSLLVLMACPSGVAQPDIVLSLPYAEETPIIAAELLVDTQISGCQEIQELSFEQNENTVLAVAPKQGWIEQTRFSIPMDLLDISGQSYPAAVVLKARLKCEGQTKISDPLEATVVPAVRRLGASATDWPWGGYRFWAEDQQHFLFCNNNTLVRMTTKGEALEQSQATIDCGGVTRLQHRGSSIVVTLRDGITVLNAALETQWSANGQGTLLQVDGIDDGIVVASEDTEGSTQAPALTFYGLENGERIWSTVLATSRLDTLISEPVADGAGAIRLLTFAAVVAPLGGDYVLWTVDPADPQNPASKTVAHMEPLQTEGAQAIVTPRASLLPGANRAIAVEQAALGSTATHRVFCIDLASGDTVWDNPSNGYVKMTTTAQALLSVDDNRVAWIEPDGSVNNYYQAPEDSRVVELAAHLYGAGLLLVVEDQEGRRNIVFLDSDLMEVWSLNYNWAFGVTFAADGSIFFLSNALLELYTAQDYRDFIE